MAEIPQITVSELAALHAQGVPVVDVREPHEHAKVRVPGVRHIPLGQVPERVDEVPTDATVYVICAGGGRSAKAVEHMRARGIDAVNVAGGTHGWIEAGFPTEGDAGSGIDAT